MNWENLIIQLGISGLIVWGGIKIALVLIARWSDAEAERTKVLAESFAGLVGKVDAHHTADISSHRDLGEQLVEVNTKLDIAFNLTPVRGVKQVTADDEDTDAETPHALEAQSIPTKPRPSTQGGAYHLQPAKRRT